MQLASCTARLQATQGARDRRAQESTADEDGDGSGGDSEQLSPVTGVEVIIVPMRLRAREW